LEKKLKNMVRTKKQLKRISNRTYPSKLCKKDGCKAEFIPTDGRQVYCCSQHRIDSNNDKRKVIDKFESEFTIKAKKNRFVLIKISASDYYKKRGYVEKGLLVYEGYELPVYHSKELEHGTDREILVCYEYGLILIDASKEIYKIDIIEK
jgi:hypothetical protein